MNTYPFHSIKPYAPQVHHDDTRCKTGNNIETENRRAGAGGRPLCEDCQRYR